jgi:hypothetical protein
MTRASEGNSGAVSRAEAANSHSMANAVEGYKVSLDGDGLRILDQLPQIIQRGAESLTPAEKGPSSPCSRPNVPTRHTYRLTTKGIELVRTSVATTRFSGKFHRPAFGGRWA